MKTIGYYLGYWLLASVCVAFALLFVGAAKVVNLDGEADYPEACPK
jgi:hypothetical protein